MWFRFDDTDPLDEIRRRFDRLFEEAYVPTRESVLRPGATDFEDEGDRLRLRLDLPGVSEKDVAVAFERNVLTVSARRVHEAPAGYRAHRQERPTFERTRHFTVPVPVQPDLVSAELTDGVLTIRLEKAKEQKARAIPVKSA